VKDLASFNYFIRPHQHIRRNRQADLLGSFEIDHEFKLRRLFHGMICGLCAFWNFVRIVNSSYRSGRPR